MRERRTPYPPRSSAPWSVQSRLTELAPATAASPSRQTARFKGDAQKAKAPYEGVQSITPEDVAETIHFVATLPPHVNVNSIELMATMQSFSPFAIHRT